MSSTTLPLILGQVPLWVWGLLLALVALGLSQARDRWVSAARLRRMPLAFLAFSAWGTVGALGWQAFTVLGFLAGLWATRELVHASGWPGAARHDAARNAFLVPGSWTPLAVMMGIFAIKFLLGTALAMSPQLAQQAGVVLGVSALNGALGSLFLARSRNLMARSAPAA
ncbi:hypothetical protein H5407_14655 [Mitsuaria sp. WAJ17]|uniref:DUF6622 family protein n=1 Tax=Mitsuaria sp. WAJ17 TaxID=2761452 RepID=UPI001603892A|nr:DUF6622 family protein [Mitsuaria sp. WAJ17]MBB2486463.1 hypothetical protein [Mitsuaria sp. WAJ17]